jgi:cytochrome c biogenesis protein CcmG, thiol:disulfide interchange protein DsbE
MRTLVVVGVLAAVASIACNLDGPAGWKRAAADTVARVGQPAPDWTETAIPDGQLSMASLRGHPVYLNFFATWCPPCNEEAPALNALQKRYASKGLRVIGVDVLESAKKAEEFRSQHSLVYSEVVDSGTLRDQYNINGLPVHVFIDRSGVVRSIVVGELSPTDMRDDVLKILR